MLSKLLVVVLLTSQISGSSLFRRKAIGDTCSEDADCSPNLCTVPAAGPSVCAAGNLENGDRCNESDQCKSKKCVIDTSNPGDVSYYCQQTNQDSQCSSDDQCDSGYCRNYSTNPSSGITMGQYCRPDSERKTTSGTAQSGEPCGSNTECANNKCVDAPTSSTAYPGKICALTSNGGKCSSAYACESGVCTNSVCAPRDGGLSSSQASSTTSKGGDVGGGGGSKTTSSTATASSSSISISLTPGSSSASSSASSSTTSASSTPTSAANSLWSASMGLPVIVALAISGWLL